MVKINTESLIDDSSRYLFNSAISSWTPSENAFQLGSGSAVQARLVRRAKYFTTRDSASSSVFSSASWIWSADSDGSASAAAGNVAFLKTFATPPGKTGAYALVAVTAADNFTFWVNGQPIGASGNETNGWTSAHVLRAALNASTNVFSVLARAGAGAFGPPSKSHTPTTPPILSFPDASWGATADIPADFPTPLNTSAFAAAAVLAPYGSGPWGNGATLAPPDPAPLNLSASTWLWSAPNSSTVDVPVGSTGFRKTVSSPSGKTAASAEILLTVDNSFDLYVAGRYVGSPPYDPNSLSVSAVWNYAQQFTVDLDPDVNVFTVIAKNFARDGDPSPTAPSNAGFIAVVRISYADNTSDLIGTDATWLISNDTDIPASAFLSLDDSALIPAVAQGPFGIAPWGQLLGTSDALDAARVPPGPYTSTASQSQGSSAGSDSEDVHKLPPWVIAGSVVVILVAVGLLALFWRDWRRKRFQEAPPLPLPPPPPVTGKLERELVERNDGSRRPSLRDVELGADLPPPHYTYSERTAQAA
ncbi:hypothetical protein B0H17DRAFT_1135031 [Mycena rosella]|uniref:Uncharacterized protein n=1 Tax=Mycena rosella TaxID=1033263 RepID=A0AAD7DEI2_MYCRO|nr:hypothetical protein B0H17DRAFT_1135031 [Mycena rosella]